VATDARTTTGTGIANFVEAHGLHDDERRDAANRVRRAVEEAGLRTVRIVLVDQHGMPRTKWLSPRVFLSALSNGVDFSGAIYSLDTSNSVFTPAFAAGGGFGIEEFTGFPDIVAVPDPTTFRLLPWADRTGWVLCDAYFSNGRPVPLDARRLLREQVAAAAELGYEHVAGLEVEFYILRRTSLTIPVEATGMPAKAPEVTALEPGYQFLSEYRQAALETILTPIRDALWDVELPPRSIENEWGPGQVEVTFEPMYGLDPADAMVLFRTVAKEICQSRGLLATFMCWPGLPNFFPSGWHLHQSLLDQSRNVFASDADIVSPVASSYAAGVLEHAAAMTVLGTPTINGLRRFRPYSFAPDRICWGVENRGALVRVQGGPGDPGTHLEIRLGEPSANPYAYMAAALAAGLDGIRRGLTPPPLVESDPYAAEAAPLPTSMEDAVAALEKSDFYRRVFGDAFVDYVSMMKRAEFERFRTAAKAAEDGVTEWEMDEYFEAY